MFQLRSSSFSKCHAIQKITHLDQKCFADLHVLKTNSFSSLPAHRPCCYKVGSLCPGNSGFPVHLCIVTVSLSLCCTVVCCSTEEWVVSRWSVPCCPCSFRLNHSALECLQEAHVLEPSPPGLNPTSDCFIQQNYWNSPLVKGLKCKLAKTWPRFVNTLVFLLPRVARCSIVFVASFCLTPHLPHPYTRAVLVLRLLVFRHRLAVPLKPEATGCVSSHLFLIWSLPNLIKRILNAAGGAHPLFHKRFTGFFPWPYRSRRNIKVLSGFSRSPLLSFDRPFPSATCPLLKPSLFSSCPLKSVTGV